MSDYKVRGELTPEMIAYAVKNYGVTEEHVRQQWEETQRLAAEGGIDAVLGSAGKAILDTAEETVTSVAEAAAQFMNPIRSRTAQLGEFYQQMMESIGEARDADPEVLLQALVMAGFMLAEANTQIAALMDGNRREVTPDDTVGQKR